MRQPVSRGPDFGLSHVQVYLEIGVDDLLFVSKKKPGALRASLRVHSRNDRTLPQFAMSSSLRVRYAAPSRTPLIR